MKNKFKNSLILNTVYLYIMQFGGYLLSLLLVPYQSRVISVEHNSQLSSAIGVMVYIQLLIQFGFTVSAVYAITKKRDDPEEQQRIYSSVLSAKLFLSFLSAIAIFVLTTFVPSYTNIKLVFWLYFIATLFESVLPIYFLRGMEDMAIVSIVSLAGKALTFFVVIVFVKNDTQYLIIPISRIISSVFSFAFACIYIRIKHNIKLRLSSLKNAFLQMKESFQYFVSRISGSIYHGSNEIALGILYPSTLAIYTMPLKLVTTAQSVASPLADSFFPYMVRTKNMKKAILTTVVLTSAVLVCCAIGEIFTEFFVKLIFGDNYSESVIVLRLLIPIIAITPINYMITFPIMVPMGLAKHANIGSLAAAIVHVLGLIILISTGSYTFVSAAILSVISEYTAVCYRFAAIGIYRYKKWKNRKVCEEIIV